MADNRKQYEVEVGGIPHTFKLDEADVERLKKAGREVKQVTASNKARTAANKG